MLRNVNSQHFFVFNEIEQGVIVELTQEGKAIAKLNPNYLEGRKLKYTKERLETALKMLENHSYNQVAEKTGN